MSKYEFSFNLSDQQLVEYYRYIMYISPKNKVKIIWIKLCIPLLLICFPFIFHIYFNLIYIIIAFAVIVLWITYISNILWNKFVEKNINQKFIIDFKLNKNKTNTISFGDNICLNNKIYNYSDIVQIVPLHSIMILFFKKTSIVIPYNTLHNDNFTIANLYKFILERM